MRSGNKPRTELQMKKLIQSFADPYDDMECWPWKGYVDDHGYPVTYYQGKHQKAHRVSFSLFNSAIPDGKSLTHTCFNRACVNPSHLEIKVKS